jgi:hypothetical protein
MSPTQRSLALLRSQGWCACVVEQAIRTPAGTFRRDAFNFGDILACHPQKGVMLVQTTSRANQAARVGKIRAIPEARVWLQGAGGIEVHGWAKVGPRGKRKLWQPTITPVTLADLEERTEEGIVVSTAE